MMKTIITRVVKAFLNLTYPPLCYGCENGIADDGGLVCTECVKQLELIDPSERCPACFSMNFCAEKRVCANCSNKKMPYTEMAAAFDYMGTAAILLKKFKYANQPHLARGLAAFLTMQFLRLEWPMPDVIIPVPTTRSHQWIRGYHQTLLLAQQMSEVLGRPVQDALKRSSGDYSQAGLNREQRLRLDGNSIRLRHNQDLTNKTILVIDDVFTTGTTLCRCAEALSEVSPASVYVLTICRAL